LPLAKTDWNNTPFVPTNTSAASLITPFASTDMTDNTMTKMTTNGDTKMKDDASAATHHAHNTKQAAATTMK